jgi:signal transduction histidine kinase
MGVGLSVMLLAWFGYTAIREWQRSSVLLADRRAEEAAAVLATALTHDMQGVQHSVLVSASFHERMLEPPYSVMALVAGAFARYPYPESFFGWRNTTAPSQPVFFNRRDRPPPWMPQKEGTSRFPVVVGEPGPFAETLIGRVQRDAALYRQFSVFELTVAGTVYQVVARLSYRDELRQQLTAIFGFTVNLSWAREHYFDGLAREVMRADPVAAGVQLTVIDENGQAVVGPSVRAQGSPSARRPFLLSFFDPLLVASWFPPDLPRRSWIVEGSAEGDTELNAAISAADHMLMLGAVAAVVLAVGLILTARAVRTSAQLAELKSDFVSSVTHELKTPLATIQAAGETLLAGRVSAESMQRDYARLLVQQAKRLSRLVDNLLAFSRVTDAAAFTSCEALGLEIEVEDAVQRFCLQLTEGGFVVVVDMPADLPPVWADQTAMVLLLDNLVDNAIRYSGSTRRIEFVGRQKENTVVLEVKDSGLGIPQDEIEQVTRKFFRGRNSGSGGTGLGLAIVKRIVVDRGGTLRIQSAVGRGTTVSVILPLAPQARRAPAATSPAGDTTFRSLR